MKFFKFKRDKKPFENDEGFSIRKQMLLEAEKELKVGSYFRITNDEILQFYKFGILGEVIHTITDPLSQIQNLIYLDENKIQKSSELLDFLNNQTFVLDKNEYFLQLFSDFLLFNNAFLVVYEQNKKLLNWEVLPAKLALYEEDNNIIVLKDSAINNKEYKFERDSYGIYKGKNSFVIHIRGYSPLNIIEAPTRVGNIKNELLMLKKLGINSINQLSKGCRWDAIVSLMQDMSDNEDLFMEFKSKFLQENIGEQGSRVLVSDRPIQVSPFQLSNRDSEFVRLAEQALRKVYNWAGIPLPLKMMDASTYNNLDTSKYILVNNVCIPLWRKIFKKILYGFMEYYPIYRKGQIYFHETEIPVLQDKKITEVLDLFKAGIIELKEARELLGYAI